MECFEKPLAACCDAVGVRMCGAVVAAAAAGVRASKVEARRREWERGISGWERSVCAVCDSLSLWCQCRALSAVYNCDGPIVRARLTKNRRKKLRQCAANQQSFRHVSNTLTSSNNAASCKWQHFYGSTRPQPLL